MYLTNSFLSTPSVRLGIMNGARGQVRAVKYSDSGEIEWVAVHFDTYDGPPFFQSDPKLVPVPMQKYTTKDGRGAMSQLGFACSYALTVHKSQGLTLREGCIYYFSGSRLSIPLVYVGFSRTTGLSKLAVSGLPAYINFICKVFETD